MSKNKIADLLLFAALFIAGCLISLHFELKLLWASVVSLVVPSLYLLWRRPKNYKKLGLSIFMIGGILGTINELVASLNKAWIIPDAALVIHGRLFGLVGWDMAIVWMMVAFFILVFYEHFFDREVTEKVSPYLYTGCWIIGLLVVAVLLAYFINKEILIFHYGYLLFGVIAIIIPTVFFLNRPRTVSKIVTAATFFFFAWLLMEWVGLKMGVWTFPGNYVGQVFFQGVVFPMEEVIFAIPYAATIISLYELIIDDGR